MTFDRREWIALMIAGMVKLTGPATTEIPEDEDDSSTSVSRSGRQYDWKRCDECDRMHHTIDLRYHPLNGNPSAQLCHTCHDYHQSLWINFLLYHAADT